MCGWKLPFSFLDIDDCADHSCQNGGTCIDGVNHYNCSCAVGYTGKTCSIGKDQYAIQFTAGGNPAMD